MVSHARTALAVALLLVSSTLRAELPTQLNQSEVSEGGAVQLTIELGQAPGGRDDLSPLEVDFRVLGRSQQSSVVMRNGEVQRSTKLTLTLAPRRSGQLEIPAFMLEGEMTQPQSLVVKAPSVADQAQLARKVRISGTLSEQQVYLQQPFIYTLRIELAEQLIDGAISAPEVTQGEALIEPWGEQQQYPAQRAGQRIQVVEQQYLITPQRSGALRISAARLDGKLPQGQPQNTVFGPQYRQFRQVSLVTDAYELEVQPVPAGWQHDSWLPARDVTLSDDWQMESLEVGQPITRTLTLVAKGVSASQLPELKVPVPDGIRQYLEPPVLDQSVERGVLVSTLTQQMTLIPTRAGAVEFAAVEQPWWNTDRGGEQRARIESTGLQISGPPGAPAASTPAAPVPETPVNEAEVTASAADDNAPAESVAAAPERADTPAVQVAPALMLTPALIAAAALALLLTLATGVWLGRRTRRPRHTPEPVEALKREALPPTDAVRKACQQQDARAVRQALQQWCSVRWPEGGGLNRLAHEAGEPLKAELQRLNRALYSPSPRTDWEAGALWSLFDGWVSTQARSKPADSGLAALNPV